MDQKIAQLMRGYEFVDFSNEIIGGGSYRNVYVEFNSSNKLSIAERGEYLMKLESELIEKIDSKINFTFHKAQKREINIALSNTFGFGGHNACVLFKKII